MNFLITANFDCEASSSLRLGDICEPGLRTGKKRGIAPNGSKVSPAPFGRLLARGIVNGYFFSSSLREALLIQ